ncbi:MAG: hypothetical protein FRX48_06865 [Lasallia pustulata]|uniref:DNA damage-binding protein 1 n=1 Tax=Lasallia pustulata TaxID=136370 RepID=A0A5M8PK99_9LECA|nr:MAG: hypothetical protein FRX48_06865 [Lasallia pustulata]
MAYLAPIHRPTSIRHALKINFLSPDEECLIVAKANRIEIYAQTSDGLSLQHAKVIYGKVTMLQRLRPALSTTDHLFIGTDRLTFFTVSWDFQTKQLRTEMSYVDQADMMARDSQNEDRCLIDPTRRVMTLELFEGVITVLPILQRSSKKGDVDIGTLGEPVPARIPELFVRSAAFLHPRSSGIKKPALALLYEDNDQKVHIIVRFLDYTAGGSGEPGSANFEKVESSYEDFDLGASHVIPVPAPAYGMLVLSETSITYVNDPDDERLFKSLREPTIFVTWEQIDSQTWLLADEYGKLYLLILTLNDDKTVSGWEVDVIGATSRASVLVYLDGGYVFVGSHQGDSQVFKIQAESISLVQTISNIAPILDFTVMDMGSRAGEGQTSEYSSGQARIVTGSGAFQDGSLRSVRSGVGLEELGVLGEMDHITNLFALRSGSSIARTDVLLVSFVDETRVFKFSSEGEAEEVDDYKGLSLSKGTLLASNLPQGRLLQITSCSVRLLDLENGMLVSEWSSPEGQAITAASANDQHVALSIGGVEAVILSLPEELRVVTRKSFGAQSQIACLTIPSILSEICIIGFWQSATVAILRLHTLEDIETVTVGDEAGAVPRSVLLTQVLPEQPPTLFVAMADGNVITFSVDKNKFTLFAKKSIILGTQHADFEALPRGDGLFNVFATCEHPSLIYGSEGRIVYSAVTAEKATCICQFDSEAYPGAIAIATPEDLKIALVDTERTTHVQTLRVHETVRRVAYSTKLKAFGLGTIRRTLRENVELVQSRFKLADEVLFKELDTYKLNDDELVESVIRADLDEGHGKISERFIVGTACLDDERNGSIRGRIIVFEVTQERTLKVVTELGVKGACRALGVVAGNIVAALIKTVVVYSFSSTSLTKLCSYRTSTAPIDLSVTGSTIAIADLMKSVSVVEFRRGSAGLSDTLVEVARHFQTAWGTAVAHVAEDTWLEADAEGNLMVLHQNVGGVTEDDRRRLEVTSEIRLGEMVNRMRRVNVEAGPEALVLPRAFLGTVDGGVYLFALIAPAMQDRLMRLQACVAALVQSPGGVPFNQYRAFKNSVRAAEEPFRFVDGELVERFLDCAPGLQEEIAEGVGVDVEDVRGMVESLRRLH